MKKIILSIVCVGFTAASALAGNCPGSGGCGDKKEDTKDKGAAKPSLVVTVPV